MKNFFHSAFYFFLTALFTVYGLSAESQSIRILNPGEISEEEQCLQNLKTSAIGIIDRALQNGYTRINRLSLAQLKSDIETEKIPTLCTLSMEISVLGRRSAMYVNSEHENTPGVLYNYIHITRHALLAPPEIQGLLLIHETLGALKYNDMTYGYTLPLYEMSQVTTTLEAERRPTRFNAVMQLARSEGTSTGVGGGDWRTIQLKIELHKRLKAYLAAAQISEKEKTRQMAFFMTLMIDFERDERFIGANSESAALFYLLETTREFGCSSRQAGSVIIKNSLADAILETPAALDAVFEFVLSVIQEKKYGSNGMCIPSR